MDLGGTYDRFMMNISREKLAMVWCAAILVLSAVAVLAGASLTVGNGFLALVAAAVPPVVMMLIWHPPPPTVAELLHDANSAKGDRR
jgi:hypothetical protein